MNDSARWKACLEKLETAFNEAMDVAREESSLNAASELWSWLAEQRPWVESLMVDLDDELNPPRDE